MIWSLVLIILIGLGFLYKDKLAVYYSSLSLNSNPTPSVSASPFPTANLVLVKVAHDSTLGDYLTDSKGMTLYVSTKPCSGQCLVNWPPFLGSPNDFLLAANNTPKIEPGPVPITDNRVHFSYNGQLLYYYKSDTKPGDTKGNSLGGVWSIVTVK